MQKRLDGLVGSAMSKSGRESLLISAAIVPDQLTQVLQLLRDITTDTVVSEGDLAEMKAVVGYELDEMANKPEDFIPELVHGAAFSADGVDRASILSVPDALAAIRPEDVYEWRKSVWRPENVIIAGTGVSNAELVRVAEPLFINEKFSTSGSGKGAPTYVGGERHLEQPDLPLIHVGLAFSGLPASHPDSYALAILQMLLGGGGSFSAGGPGKGMYSRLYTQVLNRYHWIESAKVFSQAYSRTGLFGIHGSGVPSHAKELVMVMLLQFVELTKGLVTGVELERAKNQVKSAILMGLESRMTQLEDLADQLTHRSVLAVNYESPMEVCKRIDAVQPEELQRVARTILTSKPAVVAYGPLSRMPSLSSISQWIKQAAP